MKYLLVIFFATLFASCSDTERAERTDAKEVVELGKYIYLDDNDVYHSRSTCIKLRHGKDDNGHEIYAKQPIDTADFYIEDKRYFRVCSRCVSDKIYEQLLIISERNSTAPTAIN